MSFSRILIRAPNWVGDSVMSLPALRAIRGRFPEAHIAVLARPGVADLCRRESFQDRVIESPAGHWSEKWRLAGRLRAARFDCAILLPNSFEAALLAWMAGIPRRIGYRRDGRGFLLTDPIRAPGPGEIPRHERFYYLELLRRAGILEALPLEEPIRLDGCEQAREAGESRFGRLGLRLPVVGVSPGATNSAAKRWLPERFAEAAGKLASAVGASIAVFGSPAERPLSEQVAGALLSGHAVANLAGQTTLGEFIELAAACRVFLTNDSGAMHIAAALAVPTIAIFGPTDELATGPSGPLTRVLRQPVECSPCLLRECPIDHRCMNGVSVDDVCRAARDVVGM